MIRHGDDPSRRRLLVSGGTLAATAVGTVALAGCSSSPSDDRPPIDATEDELLAIADLERPPEPDELPLEVTEEPIDEGIDRIESLLAGIPDALEEPIPNEAVRQYVEENRDRARDRLEGLESQPEGYARLAHLVTTRRWAGEAEAAYAAATDDRTTADLEESLSDLETAVATVDDDLTRTGDGSEEAVVVYATAERRLDEANRALEEADRARPGTSDVELIGELADRHEWGRATLEEATYLLERQTEIGDRSFDDEFESAASTLLDDVRDQIEELPADVGDAGFELFDEPVDGTPRERLASDLVSTARGSYENALEYSETNRLGRSVLTVLGVENDLLAIDRLRTGSDDLVLDRPDDADDVRTAKAGAVDAIESAQEESEGSALAQRRLNVILTSVGSGDRLLERDAARDATSAAVAATANYGLATVQARTLLEATEWVLDELS